MQLSTTDTSQAPGPREQVDPVGVQVTVDANDLNFLLQALRARDYLVLGPTVRDGAIVYDELASADDLPAGWTDQQEAGTYRLKRSGDETVFGYTVGPHSWKKFLHPPVLRLWSAGLPSGTSREGSGFQIDEETPQPRKMAFLGVRPLRVERHPDSG